MTQFTAIVSNNSTVATDYMHLSFSWPRDLAPPQPGQFITIKNGESTDPLLRRPFAISAFDADSCSIIYQIRGKATKAIAACTVGADLDIIGPLGNSFPAPVDGSRIILAAGGVGFGPIYYFATHLLALGAHPVVVVGARSADLIPKVDYTQAFSFCTDDGGRGFHGTVVDYIRAKFRGGLSSYELFACGPDPMLAACAEFAGDVGMNCWISMEQIMGCGVGACMGCAIRIKGEKQYARVCTEGPVFNATDVVWK